MITKFANTKYFISCDWGTSSMRLYLVNVNSGAILSHVYSQFGIKRIHRDWAGKSVEYNSKEDFFLEILNDHILLLQQKGNMDLTCIPVVASGMITSSIGLKELPYAAIPFDVLGHQAITELITAGDILDHDLLLISGVCSTNDVMRGEETQAVGLVSLKKVKDAICIFPGTHSKHIYIEGGRITGFKTYMTGELFDVVAQNSILKESISTSTEWEEKAFYNGVQAGLKENFLHALFSIRGNSLLRETSPLANRNYLSGLLVAYELSNIDATGKKVFLCGGEILEDYYSKTLHKIYPADKISIIASNIVDQLAVKGQLMILNQLNQTK